MSSDSQLGDDGLEIELVSPEEIKKRARAPQSSGLSSSLAKGLLRSSSLPSNASTPTSTQSETRTFFPETFDSHLVQESIPEEQQESLSEEADDLTDLSTHSRPILRRPKKLQKQPITSELAGSFEDVAFVPPHIMSLPTKAGRPEEAVRPGSLYEGVGRKLRGMDAVRFRRSVMQQTGFLEPTSENVVH